MQEPVPAEYDSPVDLTSDEKDALASFERIKALVPQDDSTQYTYTIYRQTDNQRGRPGKEILDSLTNEILDLPQIIRLYGGGKYRTQLKYLKGKKEMIHTADFTIAGKPLDPKREEKKEPERPKSEREAMLQELSVLAEVLKGNSNSSAPQNDNTMLLMLMEMRKSDQQNQMNMMQMMMQQQQQQNMLMMKALESSNNGLMQGLQIAQEFGFGGTETSGDTSISGTIGSILGNALRGFMGMDDDDSGSDEESESDSDEPPAIPEPASGEPEFFNKYEQEAANG
ncbi:MAG: hypothetical protein KDK38_09625 [Leptospiraceae bacterium]|nr:hypothetical protein [Leptospiraceae bacterium]